MEGVDVFFFHDETPFPSIYFIPLGNLDPVLLQKINYLHVPDMNSKQATLLKINNNLYSVG